MTAVEKTEGVIFNIQRCSLDDGPGVRTAVFCKGCLLSCLWCHNPESQRFEPEPMNGAVIGKTVTAQEVMMTVRRDMGHYRVSGGGLTLTGGEPLCQPNFAAALLQLAKTEGIHTTVETCGIPAASIERLLPYVDLWLYDMKADPERHQMLTGRSYSEVQEGLQTLLVYGKSRVILRCPVIPGCNDTPAHFANIERLSQLDGISAVERLPYHDTGKYKYQQLGREYPMDTQKEK